MPITYNIETDGLYLKGKAVGNEEGIEKGIKKGIEKGRSQGIIVCYEMGLQAEEIAQKFDISLKEVLKVLSSYKRN